MKRRAISAIIILAIVIPCYIIGGYLWAILVGIVGVLGLKEILDLKSSTNKYPLVIKAISIIDLLIVIYYNPLGLNLSFGISYLSIAFTFLNLLIPTIFLDNYQTKDAFYLIGVTLLLGSVFNIFIVLENSYKLHFIYLLFVTIMTDNFAMVTGNLIGRYQLTKISPNKTIEGAIGGSLMGTILASLFHIRIINPQNILFTIFITFILTIISQLGDLLFSKIKREHGIKDFSNLIPGHGGILDRIDSIVFTTLAYIVIILL